MSDVIVIGGGVSGLVAATYLARAGKRVTLLEAQDHLGGMSATISFGEGSSTAAQTIYALDPQVTEDLKLARHGLKFTIRDMPLVGLDGNGKHIVLQRDVHATAANIAAHSVEDARAWPRFRRELFDLAQMLRPLWFGQNAALSEEARRRIERLSRMGAMAWLDSWFTSDALKETLCFDATGGGLSPLEPGSALTLVWRAVQEISGLQGAVALMQGDTLVRSLISAASAAGVIVQTAAEVVALSSDGDAVTGIRLANGDVLSASQIVCSLPRKRVWQTMMPPLASGVAQTAQYATGTMPTGLARLLLAFRDVPRFGGSAVPGHARFVLLENAAALIHADFAARSGSLAEETPMEIVMPSASDDTLAGQHVASILLRPVPQNPAGGWKSLKTQLVERAVQALERAAPGAAAKIVAVKAFAPDSTANLHYQTPATVDHLLAGYDTRIKSFLRGLLFCGADAEPVPAVSGRAARLAAAMLTRRK